MPRTRVTITQTERSPRISNIVGSIVSTLVSSTKETANYLKGKEENKQGNMPEDKRSNFYIGLLFRRNDILT